jgi:hypothetical protein
MQHFPVQEKQGVKCLVLGCRGHAAVYRQIAQEPLNLGFPGRQFRPQLHLVKPDIAPNLVTIRLRANGIMPQAQDLANLLQQLELGVGYNRIEPDAPRLPPLPFFGLTTSVLLH